MFLATGVLVGYTQGVKVRNLSLQAALLEVEQPKPVEPARDPDNCMCGHIRSYHAKTLSGSGTGQCVVYKGEKNGVTFTCACTVFVGKLTKEKKTAPAPTSLDLSQ